MLLFISVNVIFTLDCSYFAKFSLYSYVFGVQTTLVLEQVDISSIEIPTAGQPLNDSFEITRESKEQPAATQ